MRRGRRCGHSCGAYRTQNSRGHRGRGQGPEEGAEGSDTEGNTGATAPITVLDVAAAQHAAGGGGAVGPVVTVPTAGTFPGPGVRCGPGVGEGEEPRKGRRGPGTQADPGGDDVKWNNKTPSRWSSRRWTSSARRSLR